MFSIAKDLDINIDLTLGSGWSSGGPFIKDFPEKQLISKFATAVPSCEQPAADPMLSDS